MLELQCEGIAKAKAAGKYKGRKPTVGVQTAEIRAMHARGMKPAHNRLNPVRGLANWE